MKIAVIADDLTGALDTGVQFTQWGYTTQLTDNPHNSTSQVTIINTDTRNKKPEQAYQTTYQIAKQLNHPIIYKKIDSTLRGNPGPELQAILDATGEKNATLTPTYPPTGRHVKEGHLYIHNKPITETEYIKEYATKTSYVPEILQTETPIHTQKNPKPTKPGITVIDSKTEHHLIQITKHKKRILAGSAGLADALCHTLRDPPPTITVIGSTRAKTRNQVKQLKHRLNAAAIPINLYHALQNHPQTQTHQKAAEALEKNRDIVITSNPTPKTVQKTQKKAKEMNLTPTQLEKRITQALAETTKQLLRHKHSGLIITGGATAQAITDRLNTKNIQIINEMEPGVPVIMLDQTPTITKAGGFGQPDTLIKATQYHKRRHR